MNANKHEYGISVGSYPLAVIVTSRITIAIIVLEKEMEG